MRTGLGKRDESKKRAQRDSKCGEEMHVLVLVVSCLQRLLGGRWCRGHQHAAAAQA